MPKVFIVNRAGHDFSKAKEFGTLVPVTSGNINVFRPDRDLYKIQRALDDFDYTQDFLLLSGNVLANALSVARLVNCLGEEALWNINLLIYDAKHQRYMKHTLHYDYKDDGDLIFQRDADTRNLKKE